MRPRLSPAEKLRYAYLGLALSAAGIVGCTTLIYVAGGTALLWVALYVSIFVFAAMGVLVIRWAV